MFKKILVPVDGSDLAEQALEPALSLAAKVNGELILLRVPSLNSMIVATQAEFGAITPIDSGIARASDEAWVYLHSLVNEYEQPEVTLKPMVVEGDVAGTIVDTAVSENVDLILMSTHGYSGFTRWLIGSIAEKVLRGAPCPIFVVHAPTQINKLLITLDGSELAERVLQPALAIAENMDAQICLLRVESESVVDNLEFTVLEQAESGHGHQLQDSISISAKNYLIKLVQKLGVEADTAVLRGPAAKTILEFAEKENFNLIAMATHGRSGLRRWVYGSITERVLHGAHCAMLIVRVPDDQLH